MATQAGVARALFDAGQYPEAISAAEAEGDEFGALLFRSCACTVGKRYAESLRVLKEAEGLFDAQSPERKSSFHHQRATSHSGLENLDAAFVDYQAAKEWAVETGDLIRVARADNNTAGVLNKLGRRNEALELVEGAIKTAQRAHEQALLGQFLDQKAQILLADGQLFDAVEVARRAVSLLTQHGSDPFLTEAQTTYGKALVQLGSSYLPPDSIEGYRARKDAGLETTLTDELIQVALKETDGQVYKAAQMLDVSHSYIVKRASQHALSRRPQRRRHKSYSLQIK